MEQGLVNIAGKPGNRSFIFVSQKVSETASWFSTEALQGTLADTLTSYSVRWQSKGARCELHVMPTSQDARLLIHSTHPQLFRNT